MFLDEYIEMLKERRAEVGNIRVCFTQEGNYAQGNFADLYAHPLPKEIEIFGLFESVSETVIEKYLVLGHSDQWC